MNALGAFFRGILLATGAGSGQPSALLFNSWNFLVFMAIFAPFYIICRRNLLWRNSLLCVASYVFYGWWDPRFLILVAISTSVDFMAALGAAGKPVHGIDRAKAAGWMLVVTLFSILFARTPSHWVLPVIVTGTIAIIAATYLFDWIPRDRRRIAWLCLSLLTNLGILAFFKYFNFFYGSLGDAFAAAGWHIPQLGLEVVLPVGLSFYTFQAISRTIDSFRGRFDPGYSLINYASYHAFFPQLVAGPIERAPHLMPQFETLLPINRAMLASGVRLFVWGLYMKVVVADNIAPVVNTLFAGQSEGTAGSATVGMLAFTFQIYCDFAGYSNMARGLARTLGFDLMINFDLPYFARTPAEFWQRWHISLSRWLRDYLYIPLGGNRKGEGRTSVNLMATMLLGGLWHGAAWTFVVWGAIHGGILVVFRALQLEELLEKAKGWRHSWALDLGLWAATMTLVIIAWVFFRARSFSQAALILRQAAGTDGYNWDTFEPVLFYILPLVAVETWQRWSAKTEVLSEGPFFVRYTATLATLLAIIALGAGRAQPFIYFNF